MSLWGVVDDLWNPGEKYIDELSLHQDLDTTVQNLSKDRIFKVWDTNSSIAHDPNQEN